MLSLVRPILALMLAISALAVACNGDGGDDGSDGGGSATEVVRERDGVRMTLAIDKETYGPDDPVRVSLTIENTSESAVQYRGDSPNQAGLTVTVASDLAYPQPVFEPAAEDVSGMLDAGQRIERQVEWDKVIDMNLTSVMAPPGNYTVGASFLMTREGFADLMELAAAVPFEVEGTPYIQPPVEAVRALVNSDEVKAWAEGRGDNIICAYPPHGYFYNGFFATGTAAETFDFLYRSQTENGLPICGIATHGDAWRLTLFAAQGEEPHRLTVFVALDEPVVQRVEEGGPTPVP